MRLTWRGVRLALMVLLLLSGLEMVAGEIWSEPGGLYREDPLRFWALRAGDRREDGHTGTLTEVNSLGLRGPELPPPEEGPRILALGDSCVYGVELADGDTLAAHLARDLRERDGRPWHAANGGVPGYTSFQVLRQLEELAPLVRPELVVVACTNADDAPDWRPDHERNPSWLAGLRKLLWGSSLYRMLRDRLRGRSVDQDLEPISLLERGGQQRVPLPQQEENLRRIARLCRENGAREVVFVLLPDLVPGSDARPARRQFARVGAEEGVAVDLYELWRREGLLTEAMFLPRDPLHLNSAGSVRAAADLADELEERGVLER